MQGRILQGIGSFYTVESGEACYVCKARGRFRKQRITPMVGDLVEFTPAPDAESEGSIEEILPRNSELIRPPVANIDLLLVTLAICAPVRSPTPLPTCFWPIACWCAHRERASRPASS